MEKTKIGLLEIFVTALITSILSLGGSYLLTKNQLSEEHKYWEKRTYLEHIDKLIEKKTKLYEEINRQILSLEVTAKDYKLLYAELSLTMHLCKTTPTTCEDLTEVNKKIFQKKSEFQQDLNILVSKLQSLSFLFGHKVESLATPLLEAISLNSVAKDEPSDLNTTEYENFYNKNFETIQEVKNAREKLLNAMSDEINIDNQYFFKNLHLQYK